MHRRFSIIWGHVRAAPKSTPMDKASYTKKLFCPWDFILRDTWSTLPQAKTGFTSLRFFPVVINPIIGYFVVVIVGI